MDVEVWHERGCGRIGESTDEIRISMSLGEGWWQHTSCRCPLAGTSPDPDRLASIQDWTSTTMLRRQTTIYRHVEHPRFAAADAQETQHRLDGWLKAIMAMPDAATRAAVSDSLTAHMIRYRKIP